MSTTPTLPVLPLLRRSAGFWVACSMVLSCGTAMAQSNLPVPKSGEEKEIPEIELPALPDFPKPESLLKFPTDWTQHEIFVDRATLRIDADGVVRYTLVVKTTGGAQNVTFEGLRCATGQRRVYAFGRSDRTWSPARVSTWRPIEDSRSNRQYFEFWRDTFCDGKVTEPRDILLSNVARGGRERYFSHTGD